MSTRDSLQLSGAIHSNSQKCLQFTQFPWAIHTSVWTKNIQTLDPKGVKWVFNWTLLPEVLGIINVY